MHNGGNNEPIRIRTIVIFRAFSRQRRIRVGSIAPDYSGRVLNVSADYNRRSCSNASAARTLDHAELHSPSFADHVLVPRWIPDQLHIGFIDTVD